MDTFKVGDIVKSVMSGGKFSVIDVDSRYYIIKSVKNGRLGFIDKTRKNALRLFNEKEKVSHPLTKIFK